MNSISLSEVLDAIDAGEQLDIVFITADERKKKGGEYVHIKKCWKYTAPQRSKISEACNPQSPVFKNPNHYENCTRNLRLPNGEIRKVHFDLIRKFDGMTVL